MNKCLGIYVCPCGVATVVFHKFEYFTGEAHVFSLIVISIFIQFVNGRRRGEGLV